MSSKDEKTDESKESKELDSINKEIEEIEKKVENTKPEEEKGQNKLDPKKEKNIQVKKEDSSEKKENIEETKNDEKKNLVEEKETKNSKEISLFNLVIVFVIIIAILLFSTIFAFLNLGKQTIAKGVSVKGIDISNLTISEAVSKINQVIDNELSSGIDLIYGEEYKMDFDATQIQYEYKVEEAVKNAYGIGRNENIIINNYDLLQTMIFGKNLKLDGEYNENSLNGIIDDISVKIPGVVVQASYYIEDNELIIDKGQSGIAVKKDNLKNEILEHIKNKQNYIQDDVINIKVENVEPDPIDLQKIYEQIYKEPKDAYYIIEPFQIFPEENGVDFAISMEEANAIISAGDQEEYIIPLTITPATKTIDDIGTEAFPYLISSFTTKYDASNFNRSGNLKIAAEKINGTVLMPGETFSFNEIVGKRTIEEGYKNAKIYENGQVVDGLAGGICQISSTLYNSVLLANLEIVERRNHSYTTSYVPAGRDATVVYGKQDFKFKNSRTYPIKIEANVANGIAEFKIHGIKEEVEYDIKIIPITTQTIPYTTEYVPDATLAPGQQVVTQAGHSGYKVTTYIEKRLAGIVVSKDVLSNDTYNPMKTIVNIGP